MIAKLCNVMSAYGSLASSIGTDSPMDDFGSFFCFLNFYLLYQPEIYLEYLVCLAAIKALDGCVCDLSTTELASEVLVGAACDGVVVTLSATAGEGGCMWVGSNRACRLRGSGCVEKTIVQ